jgi:dienelactone hydrolase
MFMTSIDRRTFLAAAAASAVVCSSSRAEQNRKHVPWLKEIQTPPEKLPADAPKLADLLVDADGRKIATLEGWRKRRQELRQWWLEFLGPLPAERKTPPKLEVVQEDRADGIVRQLVKYDVEPGITTEAYLCRPAKIDGKVPGIAAFHSTVDHSIRQPAGVEGAPEKAFGLRYANKGMIVFCPRNYLWPETKRIVAQGEAEKYLQRVKGSKGMAKMLYDALVAVDILAAMPEVDNQRIGAVGHSLGAKEVLYLAAFDERVKVIVSSEGGVGTRFSNWDAPWYLGPTIKDRRLSTSITSCSRWLPRGRFCSSAANRPTAIAAGPSSSGHGQHINSTASRARSASTTIARGMPSRRKRSHGSTSGWRPICK